MKRKTFRFADVFLAAAIVAGFFYLPALRPREAQNMVLITAEGNTRPENLSPDRTIRVSGPLGQTTVEISGARARIAESPCSGKQCVRQGWVVEGSGAALCVPNRVAVEVRGEGGVDAHLR